MAEQLFSIILQIRPRLELQQTNRRSEDYSENMLQDYGQFDIIDERKRGALKLIFDK